MAVGAGVGVDAGGGVVVAPVFVELGLLKTQRAALGYPSEFAEPLPVQLPLRTRPAELRV